MTITLDELSLNVNSAYKRLKNWRKVAAQFDITSGLAYRIAVERYDPKDPHLRVKLGLPAMAPVAVCVKCGEPHTVGFCTQGLDAGLAPAPVCPECGLVHTTGFCTHGLAIGPAPLCPKCGKVHTTARCKNGKTRPRKPRASVNLVDPASAARTLQRQMDADTLAALVDILLYVTEIDGSR